MSPSSNEFRHNVIALVYDFDGTLTPLPMQEYTILPEIGITKGSVFWDQVKEESKQTGGEQIVTYMRLMLEMSRNQKFAVKRENLHSLATRIQYFHGVEQYFSRINQFITDQFDDTVELRHYIIYAGQKEIIEGTTIADNFHKIFASEYYYDEYGAAIFPNVIVNDTLKTQFIFRINKGMEDMHENINEHMPHSLRSIPFQNILYIGDGLTDVPCMTVIRKSGGYAIAVFKEGDNKGLDVCKDLLNAKRVDFIAKADYSENSELDELIKLLLFNIVEGVRYHKKCYEQAVKYFPNNKEPENGDAQNSKTTSCE
ncbi:MAG: haloacid dehalogenase-like hydrolase [bacterium]|nr:haloacid dehalogenase-like hydrolase [bacterium]